MRAQLTEYGLVAEEFGGDTQFVDVSATQRTGIAELLEAIILTADAELDLRANPDQDGEGVAIEAHLDKGRGPVGTVLVQRGTLHIGDSIVCGEAFGRVRAMLDENGAPINEALPSRPVMVLGRDRLRRRGRQLPGCLRRPDRTADRRTPGGSRAQCLVRLAAAGHARGAGVGVQGR